jgi:hypothetical protein
MSDKIARITPREIAEMIVNEQAYADTRFVLAAQHDAEIERLRARVAVLERVREVALPHLFTPSMETGIALLKAVQEAKA